MTFSITLANMTDGTVQGHKAGCRDLTTSRTRKGRSVRVVAESLWTLEVETKREAFLGYNADFLAEGQDILRVWGVSELDEAARDTLYSHVGLASERQMRQDVAFGIRQLVDIAERALSPGINDPTTATQCLDELHRILRRLVPSAERLALVCAGDQSAPCGLVDDQEINRRRLDLGGDACRLSGRRVDDIRLE